MSVIVGYIDKQEGIGYIGCDGMHSGGYQTRSLTDVKYVVHRSRRLAIGVTGVARLTLAVREIVEGLDDAAAANPDIQDIFDHIRQWAIEDGWRVVSEDVGDPMRANCALLAVAPGKVWTAAGDFYALERREGYAAIGTGDDVASGALYALNDAGFLFANPKPTGHSIVCAAIEAARRYCGPVGGAVLVDTVHCPAQQKQKQSAEVQPAWRIRTEGSASPWGGPTNEVEAFGYPSDESS